jgi:hypothetical protein
VAAVGYTAVPTSWRDVQERVIFKLNVGYGLDSGAASGGFGKNGIDPSQVTDAQGNAFTEQRQYLLGDAVLGSRGVLLPSLNTYFLSRFSFDTEGASAFAAMNNVYDSRDGRALLISAGYAEIEHYGDEGTALHKLFVRAGRQYRYGTARFITNFDGVTAGYDDDGYEVSGFVGQRVSLFFDDDREVLGGLGLKLRGKELANVPVDVAVDYLSVGGDQQFVEANARGKVAQADLSLSVRGVDVGDGFGLGRAGVRARRAIGRRLYVVAEAERIFEGEVAYDFVSPVGGDVINVSDEVRLGLEPRRDATRLTATVMAMLTRDIEAYGFARQNLAADDSTSAFETSWTELGGAVRAALGPKTRVGGQYKLRARSLDDGANDMGTDFFDTSGTGVTAFHELSGEARYSVGYRKATAAAGAYVRIYDIQSPYAEVSTDARSGARFDVDYWLNKTSRVKAAGEIAQPSPTFANEIGTLMSVRLLLETVF